MEGGTSYQREDPKRQNNLLFSLNVVGLCGYQGEELKVASDNKQNAMWAVICSLN